MTDELKIDYEAKLTDLRNEMMEAEQAAWAVLAEYDAINTRVKAAAETLQKVKSRYYYTHRQLSKLGIESKLPLVGLDILPTRDPIGYLRNQKVVREGQANV